MEKKIFSLHNLMAVLFILMVALSRLLPHPANFAPVGALALFGAVYLKNRYMAYLVPAMAMWLSDLILDNFVYAFGQNAFIWFYPGAGFTYISFCLIVLVGTHLLKHITVFNLFFSSLSASVIFFLISNFGVWLSQSMGMYSHDLNGLLNCYVAGLPFFRNTLLGDFFYVGLMFGAAELFGKDIERIVKLYMTDN